MLEYRERLVSARHRLDAPKKNTIERVCVTSWCTYERLEEEEEERGGRGRSKCCSVVESRS